MPEFLAHARALGAALSEVDGVEVIPDPPQTPLFHLLLRGEREELQRRSLELARERGVWLFGPLQPAAGDRAGRLEINIGEPALEISPDEAAELFSLVLGA
jgi:hypothetical protein